MNYFKRRRVLKNINAMDLVPVRVMGHDDKAGEVTVLVPKFQSPFFHSLFPKTRYLYYKIKLDVIGSETWKVIDGEKSVQQIANHVRRHSGLDEELLAELEERLNTFTSMLYERRYITFRQLMDI